MTPARLHELSDALPGPEGQELVAAVRALRAVMRVVLDCGCTGSTGPCVKCRAWMRAALETAT